MKNILFLLFFIGVLAVSLHHTINNAFLIPLSLGSHKVHMSKHALSIEPTSQPGLFYSLSPYDDILLLGEGLQTRFYEASTTEVDNLLLLTNISNSLNKITGNRFDWVEVTGNYGEFTYSVEIDDSTISLIRDGYVIGFVKGIGTALIVTPYDRISIDSTTVLPQNEISEISCNNSMRINNEKSNTEIEYKCSSNTEIFYDPAYKVVIVKEMFQGERTGRFTHTFSLHINKS